MGIALLLGDRFENSAKPRLEEFDINVAFVQSDFLCVSGFVYKARA